MAEMVGADLGLEAVGGHRVWDGHHAGVVDQYVDVVHRVGELPRTENVPLTIDAQYVVGFDWQRQPEMRVVEDFMDHKLWAGLSIEQPQTIFGQTASPTNCTTGAATEAP